MPPNLRKLAGRGVTFSRALLKDGNLLSRPQPEAVVAPVSYRSSRRRRQRKRLLLKVPIIGGSVSKQPLIMTDGTGSSLQDLDTGLHANAFTSSSVISFNSQSSAGEISSTYAVGTTDARKSPKPWCILAILLDPAPIHILKELFPCVTLASLRSAPPTVQVHPWIFSARLLSCIHVDFA